jgi:hypothetical protein
MEYLATRCGRCHKAHLTKVLGSTFWCAECGFKQKRRELEVVTFDDVPLPRPASSVQQRIHGCYVVDGAGWAPDLESTASLICLVDGIGFLSGVGDDPQVCVPFDQLRRIDVQGYQKTQGGGFLGGGFGAKGALEGMAAATILNALTTRSSRWVIVTIIGDGGWTVIRVDNGDERAIRRQLRPAQDAIVTLSVPGEASQRATDNLVAQLDRLVDLHERGLLDAAEFQQAKAKLLAEQPD